jgi:hypothetical protein
MTTNLSAQDLRPDRDELLQATLSALKGRVEEEEVRRFVKEAASSAAPALGATASLKLAVWGKLKCEPDGQPWIYDHTVWGGPAIAIEAVGFMYTAYASWDAFFRNVTGVQATAGALHAGALQINFFKDLLPVGQFNGVGAGEGIAFAAGNGRWEKK